eukprot:2508399-Amphidinium_carterae.4
MATDYSEFSTSCFKEARAQRRVCGNTIREIYPIFTTPAPCPFLKDVKWALYSAKGTQRLPANDQFEQCFELWTCSFKHLPWANFTEKAKQDSAFKTIVDQARSVMEGKVKLTNPPECLKIVKGVTLDVERQFQVLSERELRRLLNQTRLNKSQVKGIPTITLLAEDGSSETELCYIFADTSCPFMKAKMKVSLGNFLTKDQMQADQVCWQGQGSSFQEHLSEQQARESGVFELMQKDLSGHLHLTDLQVFVQDQK